MNLSVALPCYNEEANIAQTVADVHAWMQASSIEGNIICTDDGSSDGTLRVLEGLMNEYSNVIIVRHDKNIGYGAAVRSACDAANSEWIAFMDSDGQFRAEDFGILLPHCREYSIIVGRRRKRADSFLRTVNAKCFGMLTWLSLGVWVRDVNCAMKIFHREAWKTIRPTFSSGALFNAELFARAKKAGMTWKQVDVHHYPRVRGAQTGARAGVIVRMFRELDQLCLALERE